MKIQLLSKDDFADAVKSLEKESEKNQIKVIEKELLAVQNDMYSKGFTIWTKGRLDALKAYLQGYGLLINGNIGCGKTTFFQTLKTYHLKRYENKESIYINDNFCKVEHHIVVFSMQNLAFKDLKAIKEELYNHKNDEIVLDDIASELEFNNYGQHFDVLCHIVSEHYELFMANGTRTHFTTNIPIKQLLERYGARTIDRMRAMCKTITFEGGSLRVATPSKAIIEQARQTHEYKLIIQSKIEEAKKEDTPAADKWINNHQTLI